MRIATVLRALLLLLAFAAAMLALAPQPARAALQASPAWWGASAAASSTWHYRVPLTLPATPAANQTAVFNVDFNALLAALGVTGTFDTNSPRVVDTGGTLVPTQEFTTTIYNGVTDTTAGRGEIRFLTTSANTTYWLYFDITANGTKPANPATPIDGNFENAGTVQNDNVPPAGWTVVRNNGAVDTQVRPSESVQASIDGTVVGNGTSPRTVDGTPRSGQYSFLIGARSANETQSGQDIMQIKRTIAVPASNPGVLKVRYRVQGWDSNDNGNTGSFDYLEGSISGTGVTTNYFLGPLANNYATLPFSPNKGTAVAGSNSSGYGQYNGFDMDTRGRHTANMTVARGAEPWWEVTVNLAAYAGKTITLTFSSSHVVKYRSWWHLDDVEWSVVNGTVGTPQGFGAALELPAGAGTFYAGDVLSLRARLDAVGKTGAVVADLYKPDGTLAKSGILLYNDGSHGDASANDALWTNNGSVAAQATYTFAAGDPLGTWSLVLRGSDASTAASGQAAGLVRVSGQPVTPVNGANFSNADVVTLTLAPTMSITGKVYRDTNQNGTLDSGEPAATGMFVKLVQNGTVLQVATPDATGAYALTGLRPGTYTVLQSTNNTTSDASASVPAGSVQTEPAGNSTRTITLAGGVSVTANFGQYSATATNHVVGKIFADTGAGNVNALDGTQGGSEPAMPGLTVTLRNGAGTTVATAVTGGDGLFDLALPSGVAGTPLTLVIPPVTGHDLARFGAGNTGGTASLASGTLVFTPASGNDYAGIVVSLLPVSTLVQDQAKTVAPGAVATYAHRFNADANGSVSFSLASQPPASLPQWQAILYRDNDCNGAIDAGDTVLTAPVAVLAGGSVCVVVRDLVPQAASINMASQIRLSATFTVTQGVGYVAAAQVNLDLTTVGATTGSGLTLTKAVRNLTTGSSWDTAGQALPGQTLQYRLSFRNDTGSPITNVQVNDYLPAYAVFQSAACGPMPAGLACAVSSAPASGATTGALQWNFTGAVAPGASGEVTFNWTLSN